MSGFASDLDTAQRILLQNFNTPVETVFFQEPRFFGDLRHSQKEVESRLKMNHAAEDFHLQEPMKMSIGEERFFDFLESIENDLHFMERVIT
ncbi:hypothetical protein NQ318_015828, partial [Aromia moschata]